MNASLTRPDRTNAVMLLMAFAILVLLTAVAMLARPITPLDETRYLGVAWEMWLRGDFLVPFKNGEPYSHKPPLMMWMFQAGWAAFGVNAWWPRLISPLFSAGALILTYRMAKRLWPERHDLAGPAAVVLASSLIWAISSTWIMFDVMLALFVLIGLHGTLSAAEGKLVRGFALLGVAIGLGVLAKGPVILLQVLPVVILAPWWAPGLRWTRWFAGVLAAILLGAGIALAWAIPAGMAGGEAYRDAIFWGQTANRMVESFAHKRPIWWYLALMPVLLFPWFIWPALWRAGTHYVKHGLDRGGRFCLAWSVPVLIAFSFVSGKQVHYLMPLFPAFALLVARVIAEYRPPQNGLWLPTLFMGVMGLGLVLASLLGLSLPHEDVPLFPLLWPGIALMGGAMAAYFFARKYAHPALILGLLGAVFPALVQLAAAPTLYPTYDVRPLARAIHQAQESGHLVAHAGKYHDQYHFFGRLQQPLLELHGSALNDWLKQHPTAVAVIYVKDMQALQGIRTISAQRYRGKVAALVDAKNALEWLAAAEEVTTRQD